MRHKRSAPSAYLSAPSPEYGQPVNPPHSLSPRARNIALACTAVAMLGVGGVLGGVAWYAQQPSADDAPLALVRLGAPDTERPAGATGEEAQPAEAVAAMPKPEQTAEKPAVVPASAPSAAGQPAAGAAAKAETLIGEDDPRWARDVAPVTATLSAGLADAANMRAYADRTESPAWQVLRDAVAAENKDVSASGAESAAQADADEESAGEPVQTAALDPQTDEPEQEAAVAPAPEPARVESSGAAPTGTARITAGANMRAAGRKGSRIIGTVPGNATVQLVSCDIWCEVVHNGRRGFVYKDFVSRQAAAKPVAAAKPDEPDKPEIVPARMLPQARSGR